MASLYMYVTFTEPFSVSQYIFFLKVSKCRHIFLSHPAFYSQFSSYPTPHFPPSSVSSFLYNFIGCLSKSTADIQYRSGTTFQLFQNILEYSKIFLSIFEYFFEYLRIFCNILEYSRIKWNNNDLEYSMISWSILEYSKIFRNIPEYSRIFTLESCSRAVL